MPPSSAPLLLRGCDCPPRHPEKPRVVTWGHWLVTDWGMWADTQEAGTSARASLCLGDSKACGSSAHCHPRHLWGGPTEQPAWSLDAHNRGGVLGHRLCMPGGCGTPPDLGSIVGHQSCFLVKTPLPSGHLACFSIHALPQRLEISLSAGNI